MSLRTYAYVVVARATQRFAPTGLGVSRAPEDTQADHHQKNRSGSCASSCPYGGCPGRHLGGLSACGRHYWAYICSSNLLLTVSVTALCHSSAAVQWLILVSSLIRLHGAPGTHSWCATCNRYLAAARSGRAMFQLRMRCHSIACYPQLLDAEWGLFDDTRHTVSPRSSATSNPPDRSTAKPTGLPRAWSFASRKPVTTSCAGPLGFPPLNGTNTTL